MMKTWDGEKFSPGLKTNVTVNPEATGYLINTAGKRIKAFLYKLTIARDAKV